VKNPLKLTSPLAIHAAQNQHCITKDENGYRTSIDYYGWEKKVDELWCRRALPFWVYFNLLFLDFNFHGSSIRSFMRI
jgi:hypothetical protein